MVMLHILLLLRAHSAAAAAAAADVCQKRLDGRMDAHERTAINPPVVSAANLISARIDLISPISQRHITKTFAAHAHRRFHGTHMHVHTLYHAMCTMYFTQFQLHATFEDACLHTGLCQDAPPNEAPVHADIWK